MEQGAAQVKIFYKTFPLIFQQKDDSLKDVLTQYSMIRDIDSLERKIFKQLLSKQASPSYHVRIESTVSNRDKEIHDAQKDISGFVQLHQVHTL